MDPPNSRLYSGPLSQAAQQILAVLRSQNPHSAGRSHNRSYDGRQMERYHGRQREQWAQSCWSQEENTGRDAARPRSRPQVSFFSTSSQRQSSQAWPCYQDSQASDSQASSCSPSWESSRQRLPSHTTASYQSSQIYSHRKYSEPPICQSSQTRPAASFSLSLQTPWENPSEEIRRPFIPSLPPDEEAPDEVLFPTIMHPHTAHEAENACFRISFHLEESDENDTPAAQKDKKSEQLKLEHTVALDSLAKWRLPPPDPTAEVSSREDGGAPCQQEEEAGRGCETQDGMMSGETTCQETLLPNKEGSGLLGTNENISDENKTLHCYPEHAESPHLDFTVNTPEIEGEEAEQDTSQTAEKCHIETPMMQLEPTEVVPLGDDPERTDEETTDVMKVSVEVHKEDGEKMEEEETDRRETSEPPEPGDRTEDRHESLVPPGDDKNGHTSTETLSQELRTERSGFTPPRQYGNEQTNAVDRDSEVLPAASTTEQNSTSADPKLSEKPENSQIPRHRLLIPSFPLKRKFEAPQCQHADPPPKITRRPPKWEPPLRDESMTSTVRKVEERFKPLRDKQVKRGPEIPHEESQNQSKAPCLTANLTSDPRVKDSGKMSPDEKKQTLELAGKTNVLVLTLVYRDGTTQLDPEQKLAPTASGLLVLMKNSPDRGTPEDSLQPDDSLVYLKLERTPAWAQKHTHHDTELFTRDMLLQVLSRPQLVVCYKAKDLLHAALQFYRRELSWKQVAGCHIQDPQVSGWLLDPTNPSSCYLDLLNKHSKRPHAQTPALGPKKVSQVISGLYSLYWLNMELCVKLKGQRLWELYSDVELKMISVLAAMESHYIHVDKKALRKTSDVLGAKMKQLEQEAHKAAGQMFLITSSTQLRAVLFEKLCLHERCENKKLPKTVSKQEQSTSEAALLQLQDLHPLPKIILEYRQVHKIKSTFVDGILSCMRNKNYISSKWYQTSAVTGRISAKQPNFQALPRQPLQVTKKQHIQGQQQEEEEEEVVTVHPRAMFIPREGCTFLAADFCQVELRLLAHLSSDPELLRIFIDPQADVFSMLASQWKGISEGEVTSVDREHAKRIVYSLVYGAGRERLSGILGVSAEQASHFQNSFLQTYREVQAFIQRTIHQCHQQGYVLSIMGRRRTLPNINSPDWGIRMQAERQAVNFVVQGSAADLCKMAMIRIFSLVSSSSSLSARLIAQLHDELLYEVEDSQVEQFAGLVRSIMESLQHIDHVGVHLKVPLKVAISSGKSWGSMSELNVPPLSP